MWFEIAGVATGIIGATAGLTAFIKREKMPLSERRSIRNIQGVLQTFVQDGILMVTEKKVGCKYYAYKKKNFEIHIYAYDGITSVTLQDTELNNSTDTKTFFHFEYDPQTKELKEVKENSHYYRGVGHYERNEELLKAFVAKVMEIDWCNLEQIQQEELKEKYQVKSSVTEERRELMPLLEGFNSELQPLISDYVTYYEYALNHPKLADVEKIHVLERDYRHVQLLCASFSGLKQTDKSRAMLTIKECVEEKTGTIERILHDMEQDSLYEFKKIVEIMKTNSRI